MAEAVCACLKPFICIQSLAQGRGLPMCGSGLCSALLATFLDVQLPRGPYRKKLQSIGFLQRHSYINDVCSWLVLPQLIRLGGVRGVWGVLVTRL